LGELAVIDVPAGARLPPPTHAVSAELQGGSQLLGYDWSGPVVKAEQALDDRQSDCHWVGHDYRPVSNGHWIGEAGQSANLPTRFA